MLTIVSRTASFSRIS